MKRIENNFLMFSFMGSYAEASQKPQTKVSNIDTSLQPGDALQRNTGNSTL